MHMLSSPKQRCCAYALAIQRWQYSAGNTTLPHNLSGRAGALDIDSWICPAIAHTRTTHARLKNLQNPAGKQAKASPESPEKPSKAQNPRLAGFVIRSLPACTHTHSTHTAQESSGKASPNPRLAGLVASCKCSNSSKNSNDNGQICMRVGVLHAQRERERARGTIAFPIAFPTAFSRPRLAEACSSCSSLPSSKNKKSRTHLRILRILRTRVLTAVLQVRAHLRILRFSNIKPPFLR